MAEKWKQKGRSVFDNDNVWVCNTHTIRDAKQIVREHNSYDALVEALCAHVQLREVQRKRESEEFHINGGTFMKMWDEVTETGKAALALVEVKP